MSISAPPVRLCGERVGEAEPSRKPEEEAIGRIVITEFISLDGVIEDPGGAEGFRHGGWTFEIDRGEEGDKFKLDELLEAEAQLLGRVTYEGFAARMNGMPKYAVSSTLTDPSWENTTVLSGADLPAEIGRAKEEIDGTSAEPQGAATRRHPAYGCPDCSNVCW
jgi:hypothetical protein